MAIMHLEFVVKFGYSSSSKKNISVGDKIYSNFPDYFEAWKLAGIPGIAPILLRKMISDFKSSRNKN